MGTGRDTDDSTENEVADLRQRARQLIATSRTPRHAAKKIGVSREALLGFAAGAYVRPTTVDAFRVRFAIT